RPRSNSWVRSFSSMGLAASGRAAMGNSSNDRITARSWTADMVPPEAELGNGLAGSHQIACLSEANNDTFQLIRPRGLGEPGQMTRRVIGLTGGGAAVSFSARI